MESKSPPIKSGRYLYFWEGRKEEREKKGSWWVDLINKWKRKERLIKFKKKRRNQIKPYDVVFPQIWVVSYNWFAPPSAHIFINAIKWNEIPYHELQYPH